MATWDKQSNEYNLHMSVNILYRVLIFTSSGFPNGKMKLLVGKFLEKVADFGKKKKCPVLSCLFCVVFLREVREILIRVGKVMVDTVTNNFLRV